MAKKVTKSRRVFTLEERLMIQGLLAQGKNGKQIAKILGRNCSSISNELRNHRINNVYNAKEAHQKTQENLKRTTQFEIGRARMGKKHELMAQRIDNLEQQMEIIMDFLKKGSP